jgi:ABC-type dipeptide/oligopeptide/nickel transport system permease subunit
MLSGSPPRGRWTRSATVAIAAMSAVVLVAIAGPWLAPHRPTAVVGLPYAAPGTVHGALLGTDDLGRDILSRVLWGGRDVVVNGLLATVSGCALGALVGLTAALQAPRRPWADSVLMRPLDALAAVPPLLLLLLPLAVVPGRPAVLTAVILAGFPLTARVLRAAASAAVHRAHVEAAVARGERLTWLLGRELLPFVSGPLLADAGIRFVQSVYLMVAVGFLGLSPNTTDWGTLISEAIPGVSLQPWALLVPVLLVALLAVSANVVFDDIARRSRRLLA